jgi:hypothetical protein
MAKRQDSQDTTPTSEVAEHKIEAFAEDLGALLGKARTKAEDWIGQRKSITEHLAGIRDTANSLLAQLGIAGGDAAPQPTRGRQRTRAGALATATPAPESVIATGGKKPRTMSAEARARISAAQKKRWAKLRRTQSK